MPSGLPFQRTDVVCNQFDDFDVSHTLPLASRIPMHCAYSSWLQLGFTLWCCDATGSPTASPWVKRLAYVGCVFVVHPIEPTKMKDLGISWCLRALMATQRQSTEGLTMAALGRSTWSLKPGCSTWRTEFVNVTDFSLLSKTPNASKCSMLSSCC